MWVWSPLVWVGSVLFMFYLSGFLCGHQFEKKKNVARFHSSELVNGDRTDACGTRAYVAFLGSLRTPSFGFLIKSCWSTLKRDWNLSQWSLGQHALPACFSPISRPLRWGVLHGDFFCISSINPAWPFQEIKRDLILKLKSLPCLELMLLFCPHAQLKW